MKPTASNSGILSWRRVRDIALVTAILISGPMLLAPPLQAQTKAAEYQVKAAYLLNFTKFVSWRPSTSPNFNLCILGIDPFGKLLDAMADGESVAGKKIVILRIKHAKDADDCQIVFVSTSEHAHIEEIMNELPHKGILTVSDIPEFIDHGGMVGFIWDGNRIRFEVNLTAVESSDVTLSSELLKVATHVMGGKRQ